MKRFQVANLIVFILLITHQSLASRFILQEQKAVVDASTAKSCKSGGNKLQASEHDVAENVKRKSTVERNYKCEDRHGVLNDEFADADYIYTNFKPKP